MRLAFTAILVSLAFINAYCQTVTGEVVTEDREKIFGATVYWLESQKFTTTNENGSFSIEKTEGDQKLIVRALGFASDTIDVGSQTKLYLHMVASGPEDEIVIEERRKGTMFLHNSTFQTEQLTDVELKKAACCDLAGCFNTTASVESNTTDVVTNAKELRVLGLSGVYNQVLLEGLPFLQGASYTYGVSSIPGPLIRNIFISKGANSVLQGHESISGQINVILKQPDQAKSLFVNGYVNSFLESQLNTYFTVGRKRWSNMTAFHMAQPGVRMDRDGDDFMDFPLTRRYELLNKIKFGKPDDFGWSGWMGLRYVHENRVGGQMDFNPESDLGGNEVFGQDIEFNQPEVWLQGAYKFNDKYRIRLMASSQFHHQTSWYGNKSYKSKQGLVNASLQNDFNYGKEGFAESSLKAGVNYKYLDLRETIMFTSNPYNLSYAGDYKNTQHSFGIYAENNLKFNGGKGDWILGGRMDFHNQFGANFTPRTLLRYSPVKNMSIRGSVGYGWRVMNLFPENSGILASNRDIIIANDLKPERAINTGVSFAQTFYTDPVNITFSTDYYYTRFLNQIFPDYDVEPLEIHVQNFEDKSVSHSYQADLNFDIMGLVEIRTSYNFLDVYRVMNGANYTLPFNPKHRVLTALSFSPMSNKWSIDANMHWYGKRKLPNTSSNPPEYQRPDFSESFATLDAQFSYFFSKFELYLGCENIFDFRQKKPIISWEDPFGQYFDTSSAWGPTRGREFYAGFRFFMNRPKKSSTKGHS